MSRGTTLPWLEVMHETGNDYCVRFNIKTVPASALKRVREGNFCVESCCWVYSNEPTAFVIDFNKGAERELAAYGSAPVYDPALVTVEVSRPMLTGLVSARVQPSVIARDGTVVLHATRVMGGRQAVNDVEGSDDAESYEGGYAGEDDTPAAEPDVKEDYFTKRKHSSSDVPISKASPVDPDSIPKLKPLFRKKGSVFENMEKLVEESGVQDPVSAKNAQKTSGFRPVSQIVSNSGKNTAPPTATQSIPAPPAPADDVKPGYSKSAVVKFAQKRIEPLVKLEFDNAAKTAVQNGLLYKAGKVGWTVKAESETKYRLFCNFYADMGKSPDKLDRRMYPCGTWLVDMPSKQVSPLDERAKNIWQ